MIEYKVIKVEKNGRVYTDIVCIVAGHDFILKPASFYNDKTKAYFSFLLSNVPASKE